MTSKNVGIEEARGKLGDLVTAAQQGTNIIITRNGRPAARLVAYREDSMTAPIDDQVHQEIVTGTEAAALRAAGIDADSIVETPDGTVTVVRGDADARFSVRYDGEDDDGTRWWTGTRYSDDDTPLSTTEWTNVAVMAADVAAWWRR